MATRRAAWHCPRVSTALLELVHARAPLAQVAAALEALSHAERVAALRTLGRAEQRWLFEVADPDIDLAHFVPAGTPPRTEVRHAGKNTLPLLPGDRVFEKRFCVAADGRTCGYNQARSRTLIGPGYFVAITTAHEPAWRARGAVVVDYFQVPDAAVVEGWPAVVPNSHGLQTFVYRGTRDFMRRVSAHVSIGAAYKGEKSLDHYFTLARAD